MNAKRYSKFRLKLVLKKHLTPLKTQESFKKIRQKCFQAGKNTSQSINQASNQALTHSINQPINQSIDRPTELSINQSDNYIVTYYLAIFFKRLFQIL